MSGRDEKQRALDGRVATILRRAGCANDTADAIALEVRQAAEALGWRPMPAGTVDDANPLQPPLNVTPPTSEWQAARAAMRQETDR